MFIYCIHIRTCFIHDEKKLQCRKLYPTAHVEVTLPHEPLLRGINAALCLSIEWCYITVSSSGSYLGSQGSDLILLSFEAR